MIGLPLAAPWRNSLAHIIGVKVSDTIAETTTAMVRVSANSRNMRPTRPVMNSSGMNTAISENVSEMMVKPISRAPAIAASKAESPLLHVAHDVLDHHDRIVDHEAGADGQRHQRQIVEREAGETHHRESGDQRERQRDAGDDGRPDGAQEDSTTSTTRPTASTRVNCTSRIEARIVSVRSLHHGELAPTGRMRRSRGSSLWTFWTVCDDVGAGLAADVDHHGLLAVVPARDLGVLQPVDDFRDVAQHHRRSVAIGDDQLR